MVAQDNALTNSRQEYTRIEKNCMYHIIARVRHDYIDTNYGQKDLFGDLEIMIPRNVASDSGKNITEVIQGFKALRDKSYVIKQPDGKTLIIGPIDWAEYNPKNKEFTVHVSKRIMPYYVELANHFTAYDATVAISLKSQWSQRFYELCCQYRDKGSFFLDLVNMRSMFALENKYPRKFDFEKNVINVARDELKALYEEEQCDTCFEYHEDIEVKNRYQFTIITKMAEEQKQMEFKATQQQLFYITSLLKRYFKRDKKYVDRVIKALSLEPNKIQGIFDRLTELEKDTKPSEMAPLMRYILRHSWDIA